MEWPIGATIEAIRWMNAEERRMLGWKIPGVVILLDDGGVIYAASDENGKRAGVLMAVSPGAVPEPLEPEPRR